MTLKAVATVQLQTARFVVTEWRFAPGAQTGFHVHAHDYIVVPLTTGILRLEEPGGVREARLEAGVTYARPRGVAHNVINTNDHEFRFIEIELPEQGGPASRRPRPSRVSARHGRPSVQAAPERQTGQGSAEGRDHTTSTVEPVVRRASRSRCARAASASG